MPSASSPARTASQTWEAPSAGAIAAAAAAAAEHGRARGGFEKLAALPAWVGGGDNLFRLFQPQPGTRPYFRLFTAGMGRTGLGKWLRVKLAALRGFPFAALLGVAPGLALVVLAIVSGSGALAVAAVLAGIVLAGAGDHSSRSARSSRSGSHGHSAATTSACAPACPPGTAGRPR